MSHIFLGRRALSAVGRHGVGNVAPVWFTGVMGTGILAICATISPLPLPGAPAAAVVLWGADTLAFAILALLLASRAVRGARALRATFDDPALAQTWGAPPMACFTIATGFLLIGERVLPSAWCVSAAQLCWLAGVIGSLVSAFFVPYLMMTRHELSRDRTFGSWLLPVVPPIVASVPAALLADTWPPPWRGEMLAFAYALLGIGMVLAALVITVFYSRLVYEKVPAAPLVPTMWIVLGPLGQSIAGLIALGTVAARTWPVVGHELLAAGLVYGVLVWGFAMYWLAMAIAVTVRATRRGGLDFNLGWWAFTFPVGVLTAGTDALYAQTHVQLFALVALALVTLLAAMWTLVSVRTAGHALRTLAVASTATAPVVPLVTLAVTTAREDDAFTATLAAQSA